MNPSKPPFKTATPSKEAKKAGRNQTVLLGLAKKDVARTMKALSIDNTPENRAAIAKAKDYKDLAALGKKIRAEQMNDVLDKLF